MLITATPANNSDRANNGQALFGPLPVIIVTVMICVNK